MKHAEDMWHRSSDSDITPYHLFQLLQNILSEVVKKSWRRRHTAQVIFQSRATWSMDVMSRLLTEYAILTDDSQSMQVNKNDSS